MWEELGICLVCLMLYEYTCLGLGLRSLLWYFENSLAISFWNNDGEVEYGMWVNVFFCMCIWVAFHNYGVG